MTYVRTGSIIPHGDYITNFGDAATFTFAPPAIHVEGRWPALLATATGGLLVGWLTGRPRR